MFSHEDRNRLFELLEYMDQKLQSIDQKLEIIRSNQEKIMATLDQVLQDTADEKTVDESLITLFQTVKKQLDDVLSGASLPPAVQAEVDQIFTNIEANKSEVAAAVLANTPAAPAATAATTPAKNPLLP